MAKKNERKITASGSSSKVVKKTLKPGSMATNSKMVTSKPKKTTKMPTGERPKQLSRTAARAAWEVGSAAEGAAIAGRNRDFAKKQAAKKASYSPAPMSAAAKKKAKAAGAKTAAKIKNPMGLKQVNLDKPKRAPKAGSSVVSKVVGRAKTVGREARDVVTAVGSAAQAVRKSPQDNMPVTGAIKNVAKQIKEVGKAAATGKKGTTAYKITPNAASQKNRKERGSKGYVFYDIKSPKNR